MAISLAGTSLSGEQEELAWSLAGGQLVLASDRGRKCSLLAVHPAIEKGSPSWLQLFESYRSFWGLLLWLPWPLWSHRESWQVGAWL